LKVYVDTREPKSHLKFLTKVFPDVTFIPRALGEGDFATDKVLVERKTVADLYGSIMGNKYQPGRLPNQIGRLACHDDQIVMIMVVGDMKEYMENAKEHHFKVNDDIIYGQLASIMCRERIHVMWFSDEWTALICMTKFMKKIEEGNYMIPSRREPDMLAARLLGVTLHQWYDLKKKFKTLANMAEAPDKELSTIYGIGKAKAKKVKDLINKGW
jgi:ERCC4-type nuclease